MISTIFFVQHPDSTAAVVLSLVPVFTPMLMFMRITVVSPPFWQIALSMILLIGGIYAMFRIAAKIFRIDDRIGSLEAGKDADFIVLDGPPLEWESRVRQVFIEGVRVLAQGSDTNAGAPRVGATGGIGR